MEVKDRHLVISCSPADLQNLRAITDLLGGGRKRSAAMYGMMASLPNRGAVNEIVLDLLDGLTRVEESAPDGR